MLLDMLAAGIFKELAVVAVVIAIIVGIGIVIMLARCYRKVPQGMALVRNGLGGCKVSFSGIVVFPIIHRVELMDISVKRIEIDRTGMEGLICQDNMRADIKVAFFVRVNKENEDVLKVAQSLGCARASDQRALIELFDAKFSEALKTVGKQFDFVDLYNGRDRFKKDILQVIGTDLNGYVLDDAAIDFLEQTPVERLNPDNILDAEGIKKITDLTAIQAVLSNNIQREKEKTIKKQDVEAREAILQLEKQLAETEEQQKREVASVKAREFAETMRIQQEERLKAERARITTEEEVQIADQNKDRQVIVATRNKERTDAVETERVTRDRDLEVTERERIVTLAQIEKEKAVEEEKKNIQNVIRERVIVEKAVVIEEEAIKDTKAKALADREKLVAVTKAHEVAEESLTKEVKAAEAGKRAAELRTQQQIIEAEADQVAAHKKGEAMKTIAEARAAEEAVLGMSEVNVMEAKAHAIEKQGQAEANVVKARMFAEAEGTQARATAEQKLGEAEAHVMLRKYSAEAEGIEKKAEAMKLLDGIGKEHEEFKIRIDKEKTVELAAINIQKEIAEAQAMVLSEGLRSAKIDIVGGDSVFIDRIVSSVMHGKSLDRLVDNSQILTGVKDSLVGDGEGDLAERLRDLVGRFGLTSEDVKNLTVSALLVKMIGMTSSSGTKGILGELLDAAKAAGLAGKPASSVLKG